MTMSKGMVISGLLCKTFVKKMGLSNIIMT